MITVDDFDYQLPEALIAQKPASPRDHCRLLVFNRAQMSWTHHYFYELPDLISRWPTRPVFVRNNSAVIPARLYAHKDPSGGRVEVFLVNQLSSSPQQQRWQCLTKPGLKIDQKLQFTVTNITAKCARIIDDYSRELVFSISPANFQIFLNTYGHTPIPPYINSPLTEKQLRRDYQTIYAQHQGSVAAPTAGLHFTPTLTQKLANIGCDFLDVTLHVGLGTFLGVKTKNLQDHHMHTEHFFLDQKSYQQLLTAVHNHRPLLAVGTTATRVLESIYSRIFCANNSTTTYLHNFRNFYGNNPQSLAISGDTNIFLYPPFQFQLTNHLLTNFHLPKSTLLMLVSAFASSPNSSYTFDTWASSPLGHAYQDAIAHGYQFFSFGDAMLII